MSINPRRPAERPDPEGMPVADFVAELTARPDAISRLTEQVSAFLAQARVDERAAHHVALVLDELLTNVVTRGGAPAATVSVCLTVSPARVTGEVVDGGKMFDPRREQDTDPSADPGERTWACCWCAA